MKAHLKAHPSTLGIRNWLSTHHPLIVLTMKEVICCALQGIRSIATYYLLAPSLSAAATQLVSMPSNVPSSPNNLVYLYLCPRASGAGKCGSTPAGGLRWPSLNRYLFLF
jgi:hypothetical protein